MLQLARFAYSTYSDDIKKAENKLKRKATEQAKAKLKKKEARDKFYTLQKQLNQNQNHNKAIH